MLKCAIKNEKGSTSIIVAIFLTTAITFLALVLDFGAVYVQAAKLQNATDAAALSAGTYLPIDMDNSSKIDQIKDIAVEYMKKNGFDDTEESDITLSSEYGNKYTSITVIKRHRVDFTFAKIFGKSYQDIEKLSKVGLSLAKSAKGIAPLSIDKDYLDNAIANNQTHDLILKYGRPAGGNGSFGAIDLDDSIAGGADDYKYWLSNGYLGDITIGNIIPYEKGDMSGPTTSSFNTRYNLCTHYSGLGGCTAEHYEKSCSRVVLVPVITEIDDKNVNIEGFAAFVLQDLWGQGNSNYVIGSFVNTIAKSNLDLDYSSPVNDYGVYIKTLQK